MISAVEVVLFATTSQTGVTVKVTSAEDEPHEPFAGIVYLIVTSVSFVILAGV